MKLIWTKTYNFIKEDTKEYITESKKALNTHHKLFNQKNFEDKDGVYDIITYPRI